MDQINTFVPRNSSSKVTNDVTSRSNGHDENPNSEWFESLILNRVISKEYKTGDDYCQNKFIEDILYKIKPFYSNAIWISNYFKSWAF